MTSHINNKEHQSNNIDIFILFEKLKASMTVHKASKKKAVTGVDFFGHEDSGGSLSSVPKWKESQHKQILGEYLLMHSKDRLKNEMKTYLNKVTFVSGLIFMFFFGRTAWQVAFTHSNNLF